MTLNIRFRKWLSLNFLCYTSLVMCHVNSAPSMNYESNCSFLIEETNDESKSFLWEIKGNPSSYLFGTIHVPYIEVWDTIPDYVKQVFNKTTHLYVEIDMNKPNVQNHFASCVLLPKGQTVSTMLSKEVYTRLEEYLHFIKECIRDWLSSDQVRQGYSPEKVFNNFFGGWEKKDLIWTLNPVLDMVQTYIKNLEYPFLCPTRRPY